MKKLVIAAALVAMATVTPAAQDAAKGQKFGAGVTQNAAAREQVEAPKATGGKADAFGKSYQLKGLGAYVY